MVAHVVAPARRLLLAFLLLAALLVAALPAAPVARAASCVVTSDLDGPGAPRVGTLRQELATTTCDTITFNLPGPRPWTIDLVSELVIDRSVTVQGPGAEALALHHAGAAAPDGGVLSVTGGHVAIGGLELWGGRTQGTTGAGVRVVGSTIPFARVTQLDLTGVVIDDNVAAGAQGGGLYAKRAVVTLTDSTIAGNTAVEGGGAYVDGSETVPADDATVTLTRVTVSGNTAGSGGGLYVNESALTLTAATLSGNTAGGHGGGLYSVGGTLTIGGSTVSGNLARNGHVGDASVSGDASGSAGGGIFMNFGTMTLTNATVSGNVGRGLGGGIFMDLGSGATLVAVTITGNVATTQGGYGGGGGLLGIDTAYGSIARSLIAGNRDTVSPGSDECGGFPPGHMASLGYNVFGQPSACGEGATDRDLATLGVPLSAVLNPTLAANGGPTATHALVPGSLAINLVPAAACGVAADQRGVARPQGAGCDAGAYEYAPAPLPAAPAFGDVPASDPANVAVGELARRGIVNGCDGAVVPPRFCPADPTLRHQLAALIVRAMPGWAAETWPNTFTDPTPDAELWRRVATLQHYGVVNGYSAASCAAQGKAAPCYGPLDLVLRPQAISFVTRAMVARGYWAQQPLDPTLYGGALLGTGHEQDASTYWFYTRANGGVPDYPAGGGFPVGEAATRAWFARLLWVAIQGSPAAP